jgi:GPI ethanolamine phosphate transferase 3 subunit O
MMSGFNPNFIDFTSNFNSKTATEDNLLRILHLSGRKTLHMGDDTWKELYGPYLTRSFECQSFVVEDIDSCDSTVRDNLFREYLEGGWDFIVGHYLGVDHLGHTLSTNDHPRIR